MGLSLLDGVTYLTANHRVVTLHCEPVRQHTLVVAATRRVIVVVVIERAAVVVVVVVSDRHTPEALPTPASAVIAAARAVLIVDLGRRLTSVPLWPPIVRLHRRRRLGQTTMNLSNQRPALEQME